MKNLIFPIAIEPGDTHQAFGVVVPDIPGCHSAGDSLEEAYANAKEAIAKARHGSVILAFMIGCSPLRSRDVTSE